MPSNRAGVVLPVLSLLLGATLWGTIWYPTRLLEGAGLSPIWIVLTMYLGALAAGVWVFYAAREEYRRHPIALAILGLTAGWCNVAFFLAVMDGLVVRVLLLFYLSPVWTVLLGWLVLGERLSWLARGVLVLALTGAAVMLWDPGIGVPWPRSAADWFAISAGMGFSATNVAVRYLQDVSVRAKGAANWLGVAVLAGAWVMLAQAPPPGVAGVVWLGALALGVAAIVVMTVSVQYGVAAMPVHRSAVILLFELVAGTVSSQLLTDEVIKTKEWVGGALIVAAALASARMHVERS
ncbi:MAG: DMT family transporter [Gammaproteobacteria bacterium]|nr:DMT family transporter [Gammaproteobacteria bacterium]